MEIIELLEPVTLKKADLEPIIVESGRLLKVLMVNQASYLVGDDTGLSFLVNFADENVKWQKI